MAYIFIISILALALCLVVGYLVVDRYAHMPQWVHRAVVGVLAVVFAVRYMIARDLLMEIVGFDNSQLTTHASIIVVLVANWMLTTLLVLIFISPYYKSSRSDIILRYFGGVTMALYLCTFGINMTGLYGAQWYSDSRAILISIELGIMLALVAVQWIRHTTGAPKSNKTIRGETSRTKSSISWPCSSNSGSLCDTTDTTQQNSQVGTEPQHTCIRPANNNRAVEVLVIVGLVLGMMLANFPSYLFQAIIGEVSNSTVIDNFTLPHCLLIAGAFVLAFVMYCVLRDRQPQTIRYILLYIALAGLVSFNNTKSFATFADVADWPIHLCNLTIYLLPICIICRSRRLFAFVAHVSIVGAFIALLFPTYGEFNTWASPTLIRFYSNHYVPFILPILCSVLGVFPRFTFRDTLYGIVGMFVYFALMLVANAYCIGTTPDIDFFYQNGTQITSVLSLGFTRNVLWQFSIGSLQFNIYPVYFVIFWAVLVFDVYLLNGLYQLVYRLEDWHSAKRMKRYMARTM